MDIVTHANTLPWLIDPQGFMSLISYALGALALSLLLGLLYASLHRLMSARAGREDRSLDRLQISSCSDMDLVSRERSVRINRQRKSPSETRAMISTRQEAISHEA